MYSRRHREVSLALVLAGIAGFIDAVGFLSLSGFFVSFMTGNTTQAGVAFAQGHYSQVLGAGGVITAFVVGVVAGSLVADRTRQRFWVLAFVTAVLAVAATMHSIPGAAFAAAPLLAIAMGAENATFKKGGEVAIGLTYMTGTLVKMGQNIARLIEGDRVGLQWIRYFGLWSALAIGAVLGGFAYLDMGLTSIWIATAVCAAAALSVRHFAI